MKCVIGLQNPHKEKHGFNQYFIQKPFEWNERI